MTSKTLLLFTRTPLHVGAGASVGLVDQPVIRERHTGFPIIPGSAIKGVLRDHFTRSAKNNDEITTMFGREQLTAEDAKLASAGHLSFSEARLLAFPVRSAKGSYALITCPLALSRYARESGITFKIPDLANGSALACSSVSLQVGKESRVVLEEYVFKIQGDFPEDWAVHLSELMQDAVLKAAKTRFVLLSDGEFSHFARNACRIDQHIRIDDETGTVAKGALFNTETVPSETLFHATLTALRKESQDNVVFQGLATETLFQFGGDATTGLGFCTVKIV